MRVLFRLIAVLMSGLLLAACGRREGLNFDCVWVPDPGFQADIADRSHLRHLLDDIATAEELAIRHGDHTAGWRLVDTFGIVSRHGGIRDRDAGRVAREQCRVRLLATIASAHGVTLPDMESIRPNLEHRGLDLPVTIPVIIVFSFALRSLLRWLRNRFTVDERVAWVVATLIGSIAITIGVLTAGAAWAVVVEIVRVGNEHLGSRGRIESLRNNFLVLFALGVFASWVGSAMAAARSTTTT